MYESTVCIDLGASYTKIAYRAPSNATHARSETEHAKILSIDGGPLIPSLAIKTRSAETPWLFGREAAEVNPDSKMKVFYNWKANLFRSQNDRDSASAVVVAEHFFGWLRKKVQDAGVDLRHAQTRIAMPAFESFEDKALVIAQCMELSGWESSLILKATEPHANAIGLFSKGRNVVNRGADGKLLINYGKMFGQENTWVQTARAHTLYGTRTNLVTAMVVDIGAFTTDLASITFDVTDPHNGGDGLERIEQESHDLGVINNLDRPLFTELAVRHGFDWSEVPFRVAEMAKRAVYSGESYLLPTRSAGLVALGDGDDRSIVDRNLRGFSDALWSCLSQFIDREKPTDVHLTGGGSLIGPVRSRLNEQLRGRALRIGLVDAGGPMVGNGPLRLWHETGEGLHRLATALGGASVILQGNPSKAPRRRGRPVVRMPTSTQPNPRYAECRCRGANKDCCFCGGRGFYSR